MPAQFEEARQLARAASTREWARQNPLEFDSTQSVAQTTRIRFAARCERDVGPTGVLVRERPGRLSVPCQIDCRKLVGHRRVSGLNG